MHSQSLSDSGERWTGQAIAILPENPVAVDSDENCTAVFPDSDSSEENESYIYLGDQIDGLMDMSANQDFTLSLWVKPVLNDDQNLTLFNKRIPEDDNPDYRRGYEAYLTSSGR